MNDLVWKEIFDLSLLMFPECIVCVGPGTCVIWFGKKYLVCVCCGFLVTIIV